MKSNQAKESRFLWECIMKKDIENIKKFLNKYNFSLDTPLTPIGLNALHQSVSIKSVPLVEYFVEERKMEIDAKDTLGRTPLHYATAHGSLEITKYLYSLGANPNSQTIGGETPLMRAAQFKQKEIIDFLIESPKIDIKIKNKVNFYLN